MSAPDYKVHDPKGWCGNPQRGAALGRNSYHADKPKEWEGKLYLRKIRLNAGGYDSNGTYFGHGSPLYWCSSADNEIDFMIRAPNRFEAEMNILQQYPKAKFAGGRHS